VARRRRWRRINKLERAEKIVGAAAEKKVERAKWGQRNPTVAEVTGLEKELVLKFEIWNKADDDWRMDAARSSIVNGTKLRKAERIVGKAAAKKVAAQRAKWSQRTPTIAEITSLARELQEKGHWNG